MDKEKIKVKVTEVEELVNELVREGKLNGDQAKAIIYNTTVQEINRELNPPEEV